MAVKKRKLTPRVPRVKNDSLMVRRRVLLNGQMHSISVEGVYWSALKDIAGIKKTKIRLLIKEIRDTSPKDRLSSRIRIFALNFYRNRSLFRL